MTNQTAETRADPLEELRATALRLVEAQERYRDAVNGLGHPGEDHDRVICPGGHDLGGGITVHDLYGDCSACGGAQYGTEDDLTNAYANLRHVLGLPLRPWEEHRVAALTPGAPDHE